MYKKVWSARLSFYLVGHVGHDCHGVPRLTMRLPEVNRKSSQFKVARTHGKATYREICPIGQETGRLMQKNWETPGKTERVGRPAEGSSNVVLCTNTVEVLRQGRHLAHAQHTRQWRQEWGRGVIGQLHVHTNILIHFNNCVTLHLGP